MIAALLAAQIVSGMISSAPPLSPAEAARILARSPGLSNRTHDLPPLPDGPTVTINWASPTTGPFGEFEWYPAGRRLDGTYLSEPPGFYSPSFYPLTYANAYSPRFRSGSGSRLGNYGSVFQGVQARAARPQGGAAPRSINHGAPSTGRPSR